MISTGARYSNRLQWLALKADHQGCSPSNGRQSDMPYYTTVYHICVKDNRNPHAINNKPIDWLTLLALTPDYNPLGSSMATDAMAWRLRVVTWWRYQMETFSALLAIYAGNSPTTGEFPAQRPMTRSFDIFFDLRLIKRLSKQSRRVWFETPSRSLWRHRNEKRSYWLSGIKSQFSTSMDLKYLCHPKQCSEIVEHANWMHLSYFLDS